LTLPNGVTVAYSYDADSHVTGITYSAGSTQLGKLVYSYDANGRRGTMGGSLAAVNFPANVSGNTFNADNGMTGFNGAVLSYDANGNLRTDGTNTYTWDARNHLSGISGGATASFVYDAFGRRMKKTISGAVTQFLYDGFNPMQELNGSNGVVANLLTGLRVDEFFSRTDTATSAFLSDALGSTVGLVNSSGAIATNYTYQPFGGTTVGGSANGNSYQFTGRENDGNGLYFYRTRYYSPTFQRFIAQDPLDFRGGGLNLYSYVLNDPASFRDPTGRLLIGIVVGGVVGGVEGGIGAGLQGGSTSDIILSAVLGGIGGAALGFLDPTEGAFTVGELAGIGGAAGFLGDLAGQGIANRGRPCKSLNIGEAVGAGIGGALAGVIGAQTAIAAAGLGASELGQALAAAGLSATPSTLGGPIGAALGPTVALPSPTLNLMLPAGPSQ
jgi:RHS repeat-associated protein